MQALHNALSHIEQLVLTTNITHTETFNSYTHVQWWYKTHAAHVHTSASLFRVCKGESSFLTTKVLRSIAVSDVTSMSIVNQCYLNSGHPMHK